MNHGVKTGRIARSAHPANTPANGLAADNEAMYGDELGLGDELEALKRDGVI